MTLVYVMVDLMLEETPGLYGVEKLVEGPRKRVLSHKGETIHGS